LLNMTNTQVCTKSANSNDVLGASMNPDIIVRLICGMNEASGCEAIWLIISQLVVVVVVVDNDDGEKRDR